jgi:hypothetical protein
LAAALNLALAAALKRFDFVALAGFDLAAPFLYLAHLARAAAAMRRRPAADKLCLPVYGPFTEGGRPTLLPPIDASCSCRLSISSLISMARFN